MSRTPKSCLLPVGIVSLVLLAVFVLSGCGESLPTVDPKAKQSSTVDPKVKQSPSDNPKPKQTSGDGSKTTAPPVVLKPKTSSTVDPEVERKINALIEKLKDKDVDVRDSAAIALGQIGAAAKDAVPALTEVIKDKDKSVRKAAQAALNNINAEQ